MRMHGSESVYFERLLNTNLCNEYNRYIRLFPNVKSGHVCFKREDR